MATKNTIKGVGEKEQTNKRTIWTWVNSKCQKRSYVKLHSLCICRLTLAWISSENSTTHEECWLILTGLPSLRLDPVSSAVRCRLATRVTLRQLTSLSPFFQFLSRSLTHFQSRRDLESKPFVWFCAKTKGSSAWRTAYIVLLKKLGTPIYIYIYIYTGSCGIQVYLAYKSPSRFLI